MLLVGSDGLQPSSFLLLVAMGLIHSDSARSFFKLSLGLWKRHSTQDSLTTMPMRRGMLDDEAYMKRIQKSGCPSFAAIWLRRDTMFVCSIYGIGIGKGCGSQRLNV